MFKKQIDNLKTNHRGIFVLTDNRFQPLSRMSVDRRAGPKASDEAIARAQTVGDLPARVRNLILKMLTIMTAVSLFPLRHSQRRSIRTRDGGDSGGK